MIKFIVSVYVLTRGHLANGANIALKYNQQNGDRKDVKETKWKSQPPKLLQHLPGLLNF